MELWCNLFTQEDLCFVDKINKYHRNYLEALITPQSFEEHNPEYLDGLYFHYGYNVSCLQISDQYTDLLKKIASQLTLNQLANLVRTRHFECIEDFQDSLWLGRHLLDLVLQKIQDFYDSYPIQGCYTIIEGTLTCASRQDLSEIKKYLTDEALDKFYSETKKSLQDKDIIPRLSVERYNSLYHEYYWQWYIENHPPSEGPKGAVGIMGPSGACHRCIIKDKEFLSNLYLHPGLENIPNDQAYPGDMTDEEHQRANYLLGIGTDIKEEEYHSCYNLPDVNAKEDFSCLKDLLQSNNKTKVIISSATPITKESYEIPSLINLLLPSK